MDADKVGRSIAFLRKQYGMTQQALADMLGVSDKAVSKWETGRGVPDISLLARLSVALDIDIESILEGNLARLDLRWKGVLVADYPHGMSASTAIFSLPVVEFQIGLFMLAGIREIFVAGDVPEVDTAALGISLIREPAAAAPEIVRRESAEAGVMVISGLDFIYGKDLTKLFRRILHDAREPIRLVNSARTPLSISFCPARCLADAHQPTDVPLDRGVIAFPINDHDDMLDASQMIRVIERQHGERVGDLREIAERRGFVD